MLTHTYTYDMGKIITVRKTTMIETVKVEDAASERVVRQWMSEMFQTDLDLSEAEAEVLAKLQDISELIEGGVRFARDADSKIMYLITPEEFEAHYQNYWERILEPEVEDTFKIEE